MNKKRWYTMLGAAAMVGMGLHLPAGAQQGPNYIETPRPPRPPLAADAAQLPGPPVDAPRPEAGQPWGPPPTAEGTQPMDGGRPFGPPPGRGPRGPHPLGAPAVGDDFPCPDDAAAGPRPHPRRQGEFDGMRGERPRGEGGFDGMRGERPRGDGDGRMHGARRGDGRGPATEGAPGLGPDERAGRPRRGGMPPMNPEQVFTDIDADGDGSITLAEWQRFHQDLRPPTPPQGLALDRPAGPRPPRAPEPRPERPEF